jgi:hypothetical protein
VVLDLRATKNVNVIGLAQGVWKVLAIEDHANGRVVHEVADAGTRPFYPVEVLWLRGYDDAEVVVG